MKKIIAILSLMSMSSTVFAAKEFDMISFEKALKKDLAIGTALFDCLYEGQQLSEIYEKAGLIKSSDAVCRASMEKAIALGATRQDFLKAIDSKIQK